MKVLRMSIGIALVAFSSCGGSSSGGTQASVAQGVSSWAVLDLPSHQVTYLASEPSASSSQIIFRRVHAPDGDVFVGIYALTQSQWALLDASDPNPWLSVDNSVCNHQTADGPDHPAYNLDYPSVEMALSSYGLTGGGRLDLPTDMEWTTACGVSSGWWWGTTSTQLDLDTDIVCRESVATASRINAGGGMDTGGPLSVGSRAANSLGLYDMLGNIWQWTNGGNDIRGGSWFDGSQTCRAEIIAGASSGISTDLNYALIGARPVLRP